MTTIIATVVPEHQRLLITAQLFKHHFPFKIEPVIYQVARQLSSNYNGAYWRFFTLGNLGFYMAPDAIEPFNIICENGHEGQVSAEAFGIIACLYAYSGLSFTKDKSLAKLCAEHFHLLRDYMLEHPEATNILAAID